MLSETPTDTVRGGLTVADIVRQYFPNVDDDEMGFIIWNQTGWPCFWSSPIPGDGPEDCFRLDLARYKWDLDNCQTTGIERYDRDCAQLRAAQS